MALQLQPLPAEEKGKPGKENKPPTNRVKSDPIQKNSLKIPSKSASSVSQGWVFSKHVFGFQLVYCLQFFPGFPFSLLILSR